MEIYFGGVKTNNQKTYDYVFGAKICVNIFLQSKNEQPKNLRLYFSGKNICKYILPIKTNIARPYKGSEKNVQKSVEIVS